MSVWFPFCISLHFLSTAFYACGKRKKTEWPFPFSLVVNCSVKLYTILFCVDFSILLPVSESNTLFYNHNNQNQPFCSIFTDRARLSCIFGCCYCCMAVEWQHLCLGSRLPTQCKVPPLHSLSSTVFLFCVCHSLSTSTVSTFAKPVFDASMRYNRESTARLYM